MPPATDQPTALRCWRSEFMECGPSCMAYLTEDQIPSSGPSAVDYRLPDGTVRQSARCSILVTNHRITKHLVIIANVMSSGQAPKPPGVLLCISSS